MNGDDNLFVVIERVHPDLTIEDLNEESGLECQRLISGETGRTCWKVKAKCASLSEKKTLLQQGVKLGYRKYKVSNYAPKNITQCFKCQKFGHTSVRCTNTEACKKCSLPHSHKACTTDPNQPSCPNCKGPHPSTFKGCPSYKAEIIKTDLNKMSYSQAVAKPEGPTLTTRIAMAVSSALCQILISKLKITQISTTEVCNVVAQSVSTAFRTAVKGDHIQHLTSHKNLPRSQPNHG
jgi:hypothetical protein